MSERIKPKKTEDGHWLIDFTQEGSPLLEGLKKPVRAVEFSVGAVQYRVPRGADDPIPDNVVEIGGLFHNLDNGKMGKNLKDVV
jgi:hypothetical protein